MAESDSKDIAERYDISTYWLYSDLREIIILPKSLANLIQLLHELDVVNNEMMLITIINKFMESCYSIQSSQRLELLDFIVSKASSILEIDEQHVKLKSLITLAYCIMMASYRDHNRVNSEVIEIQHFCEMIHKNILDKIKLSRETTDFLVQFYIFVMILIKQLNIWMTFIGLSDDKLQSITLNKRAKKRSDTISQSLNFVYKKLSEPLEELSYNYRRPNHHLILLTFYQFKSLKDLEREFQEEKVTIKRAITMDENEVQTKTVKQKKYDFSIDAIKQEIAIGDFTKVNQHLEQYVYYISERKAINNTDLIELFKMTPAIMKSSEKEFKNNGKFSLDLSESIFINLLKLWTYGLKQKMMSQFEYSIYYWPLVSKQMQNGNFKLKIKTVLDFLMEFQAKLIYDILNIPSWVMELFINSIECIINNATIDKNLSVSERKDIIDLIGEIGKVLQIIFKSKNMCRVLVVIPHQLFIIVSELQSPLPVDVKRTLRENIVSPIISALNKHTLDHLKMELKGAAREVCREFLEIK